MDLKTRKSRKEQGRLKLHREREDYLRLVEHGLTNAEPSRRVGVNPRTGREWRNSRPEGGKKRPRPPARAGRAASSPSGYLSDRLYCEQDVETVRRVRMRLTAGLTTETIARVLPCVRAENELLVPVCSDLEAQLRQERERITRPLARVGL